MNAENVIPSNDLVCLNSLQSSVVLECEVLANRASTVSHKSVRVSKLSFGDNFLDEVCESRLKFQKVHMNVCASGRGGQ